MIAGLYGASELEAAQIDNICFTLEDFAHPYADVAFHDKLDDEAKVTRHPVLSCFTI